MEAKPRHASNLLFYSIAEQIFCSHGINNLSASLRRRALNNKNFHFEAAAQGQGHRVAASFFPATYAHGRLSVVLWFDFPQRFNAVIVIWGKIGRLA